MLIRVLNLSAERFVTAVFTPCLRDRFEFDIGGFATEFAEVCLDGFHFRNGKIELSCFAKLHQLSIVELQDGNDDFFELVVRGDCEFLEYQWAHVHLLNRVVCQHFLAHPIDHGSVHITVLGGDPILAERADLVCRDSDIV